MLKRIHEQNAYHLTVKQCSEQIQTDTPGQMRRRSSATRALLAFEFVEPRNDDGRVKAAREVRIDKGQADGSRPVDQKGPGHR